MPERFPEAKKLNFHTKTSSFRSAKSIPSSAKGFFKIESSYELQLGPIHSKSAVTQKFRFALGLTIFFAVGAIGTAQPSGEK